MSKRSKYRAILNSDETPIDMHAVVPSEGRQSAAGKRKGGRTGKGRGTAKGASAVRSGGQAKYVVRDHKRVGSGRMPAPPNPQNRQVRVNVKTHDRGRGAYKAAPSALVNYVGKEGRTFDRGRDIDAADREDIKDRWRDDRMIHHWMPAPQDGDKMTVDDVKTMTRTMMEGLERQTGKLDWFAGAEWKADAANPGGKWHVHIAVRGVQEDRDISFHPITERHWLRHHAEEAATDVLGWRGGRTLEDEHTRRERGRDLVDERNERERERGRTRDLPDEFRDRERPSRHGRDGREDER